MSPKEDTKTVVNQTSSSGQNAGIEIDPEIKEIFVEEARDVLSTLEEFFPLWRQDINNKDARTETRRAFHTLKGSGRMVSADAIGELAWSIENLLNRVIDGRVEPDETLMSIVSEVIALIPSMVTAFELGNVDFDQGREANLRDLAIRMANGEEVALILAAPVEEQAAEALAEEIDPDLLEIFIAEARNHLATMGAFIAGQQDKAPFYDYPSKPLQAALHTLKGSAHMANIQAIATLATPVEKFVKELLNYHVRVDDDCIELFADCASYVHQVVDALAAGLQPDTSELNSLVARVNELRDRMLEHVLGQDAGLAKVDPVFLNLLMADGMQMVLDAEKTLAAWQQGASDFDPATLSTMAVELRELESGAEKAGFPALAGLSSVLAATYDHFTVQGAKPAPAGFDLLLEAHDTLLNMADGVAAHQDVLPVDGSFLQRLVDIAQDSSAVAIPDIVVPSFIEAELLQEANDADREVATLFLGEARDLLDEVDRTFENWKQAPGNMAHGHACNRLLHTLKGSARMAGLESLGTLAHDMETIVADIAGKLAGSGLPLPVQLLGFSDRLHSALGLVGSQLKVVPVQAKAASSAVKLPADLDEEVVELFFGEADELLEELEKTLQRWLSEPKDSSNADIIKRNLHTFKGGARMAGLLDLGEESHHYESYVVDNEAKVLKGDGGPINEMLARYDKLQGNVEMFRQAYYALHAGAEDREPEAIAQAPVWQTADILPFTGKYKGLYPQKQAVSIEAQEASQEVVRIPAPVLDTLVNLAGESSISRSQVEQNINEFIHSLDEMEATIRRMHDQVRRLGIETDAQVMFRREQIESSDSNEGFDPLEMDRYSQLQQLARGLLESASDLQDLRDTLLDKSRDAESLLLQQSRINTDLQESLMRTRMVPFSRVVPRLRRVVRQVGSTVGKQIQLQLGNVEGELDRSVLERIMAPLEHMLRNAIDHGIEDEATRRDLGKNPEGTISISFSRDGADILIRLADDGRGLDVEAIRAKAFSLGLLNEHSHYTDNEVVQFIFHPGFSTATEVTQTSGRGVGMDVVSSEVRQLGGSVGMTTKRGAGTEFLVRLPFTVSVNRALMIELGEDSYSLALNSISGVTRMTAEQLRRFYNNPQEKFEYGGEQYEVRYLGNLLSSELRPTLDTALGQVPLVLTRIDNINYAVQVDALIGSREIVVKSLGTQFSRVPGLSGATVLGDGRVVVILDLQGLLRAQSAAMVLAPAVVEEIVRKPVVEAAEDYVQTVMVVDDSVTVRKVTSRFLEREGFRVITARDGVDAMRALQDITPDLMLLDIEMPRMDGFEVARLVRSTQRLKDLPIIMITSRTGDKHRERALAMGVNQYLGKPYQEDVLIREVYRLLTTAETA